MAVAFELILLALRIDPKVSLESRTVLLTNPFMIGSSERTQASRLLVHM